MDKIHKPFGLYEKYFKRGIDCIIAFIMLLVLSPIMLLIALLVRWKLGTPVIFLQERPGKNEKIYTLYKFRTMTEEKNTDGSLLEDEKRLTSFGKVLRSTSLDELPELVNILKGDMAFVGPRPLLVRYLPFYTEEEKQRHDVRPGLTGLAQINGRNYTKWEERFRLDVKYVEKITFCGDLKILAGSVKVVFFRKNISVHAMDDFDVYRKAERENEERE